MWVVDQGRVHNQDYSTSTAIKNHKKAGDIASLESPVHSLPFREDDGICKPVEDRRCRFMASVPEEVPTPTRLPAGTRDAASPDSILVEVEERGRVEDEAILGKVEAPLRVALLGVPEARFLYTILNKQYTLLRNETDLFLMISVFNESGRTTP